jgi:hypothetical protein
MNTAVATTPTDTDIAQVVISDSLRNNLVTSAENAESIRITTQSFIDLLQEIEMYTAAMDRLAKNNYGNLDML